MITYIDFFLKGFYLTIQISFYSFLGSLVLGILGVLLKTSRYKIVKSIGYLYTTLVRSIPELIWIFLIYFSLNDLINYFINIINRDLNFNINLFNISPFISGICALSFCFGAYITENFISALSSIDKGQKEAGKALGLNKNTIFFRIIIPQMFYFALPSLTNSFMILLKDTALLSVIGINEIMMQTKSVVSIIKEPFACYLISACLYLFLTFIIFMIFKLAARYLFRWALIK